MVCSSIHPASFKSTYVSCLIDLKLKNWMCELCLFLCDRILEKVHNSFTNFINLKFVGMIEEY